MSVRPNVLVVEDESISARAIKNMLEIVGCRVACVLDRAEDAVDACETRELDLILMDIRLKGEMTGIEAAAIIRERYRIPVLLVTAYSAHELFREYGLSEGFPYLSKPVEEGELAAMVNELVILPVSDGDIS